jgi:hypothetical protein
MARLICRCGEALKIPSRDAERLTCSRCGANIRIRRKPERRNGSAHQDDGYVRFYCPCGRRLKVRSDKLVEAGKCPSCGRVVPVPLSASEERTGKSGGPGQRYTERYEPEARTAELDLVDLKRLEQWSNSHRRKRDQDTGVRSQSSPAFENSLGTRVGLESGTKDDPPAMNEEAGLRICPACGKPLHMNASICRSCGEPAPRR